MQTLASAITPLGSLPLIEGRTTWRSPLGALELTLDTVAFDFHLDAAPDFIPAALVSALSYCRELGLVPMDEDECEAELLDNGWTRVYLVPAIPVDDAPLIPIQRTGDHDAYPTDAGCARVNPMARVAGLAMLAALVTPWLDNVAGLVGVGS